MILMVCVCVRGSLGLPDLQSNAQVTMITSYDYFQNSTVYFDAYSGMITTAISMITAMETGECCHQIRAKLPERSMVSSLCDSKECKQFALGHSVNSVPLTLRKANSASR